MAETQIGFIGAGNIAMALARGLLKQGIAPSRLSVSDPMTEQTSRFHALGVAAAGNNLELAAQVDVLILSVKPDTVQGVATEIRPALRPGTLVISVAAGVTLGSLEAWLGPDVAIIRCMPNTPALIQQGATGAFANSRVSDAQKSSTTALLTAIGVVEWVADESLIDLVTAVSGSGPAYFFRIMELMEASAVELGLSPAVARRLIVQTALGAAGMAHQTGEPLAELRRKVTSPGGTTAAALASFEQDRLGDLLDRGIQAALRRARELAALSTTPQGKS